MIFLLVVSAADEYTPRIHYTPPCYRAKEPHDIAAAVYREKWHVMAGCWSQGGWQHLESEDLVRWTAVGEPMDMGGSGAMVLDEGIIRAVSEDVELRESVDFQQWTPPVRIFPAQGKDPILWRNGSWYAGVATRDLGYAREDVWIFDHEWRALEEPLIEVHSAFDVPITLEFLTPDYFVLGSPVFLASLYGPFPDGSPGQFAVAAFFVRTEDAWGDAWAVDWSPFTPTLDLATSKGATQFGCCPKTANHKDRRVLFGWLQNGGTNVGEADRVGNDVTLTNNTMTLPRDLTIDDDGNILQAFVPELRQLRRHYTFHQVVPVETETIDASVLFDVAGNQIELKAVFRGLHQNIVAGLVVFAAPDASEYTAILIENSTLVLDRRRCGSDLDNDLRGGPLAVNDTVTLHVILDHSIVSVIANNRTALTAWVHPSQPRTSTRIGSFFYYVDSASSDPPPPLEQQWRRRKQHRPPVLDFETWQLAASH